MSKKFQGEIMTCVVCGLQERSHPQVETGWRCLEVDDTSFYACPAEFPSDGCARDKFKTAYQAVLACCVNEINKKIGAATSNEVEAYRLRRKKEQERSLKKGFGSNN